MLIFNQSISITLKLFHFIDLLAGKLSILSHIYHRQIVEDGTPSSAQN